MTAVVHPDVHTRNLHQAAGLIAGLANQLERAAARMANAYRAGNQGAAVVAEGDLHRYRRLLTVNYQRSAAACGEPELRRALTNITGDN